MRKKLHLFVDRFLANILLSVNFRSYSASSGRWQAPAAVLPPEGWQRGRGPEGPESGQNMRVRGPEGPEDEQS